MVPARFCAQIVGRTPLCVAYGTLARRGELLALAYARAKPPPNPLDPKADDDSDLVDWALRGTLDPRGIVWGRSDSAVRYICPINPPFLRNR